MTKKRIIIAAALAMLVISLIGGTVAYVRPQWVGLKPSLAQQEQHNENAKAHDTDQSAQESAGRIQKLVRGLVEAQDKVAYGEPDGLADQQRLFTLLAEQFDELDAGKWQKRPNTDDVLVYVLSGGESEVLRRFVESSPPSPTDKPVVDGVLYYVEQNRKESLAALSAINVMALKPALAGPVALAKASLMLNEGAKKANDALDIARLVSPHTAIEEAAMRRQIPVVLSEKDLTRGLALLSDYVGRYGKSSYSPKLIDGFASELVKNFPAGTPKIAEQLADSVERADDNVACDVLLAVGKAYLAIGKLETVKSAAGACIKREKAIASSKERANVYLAAAEAPSEQASKAAEALAALKSASLSSDDNSIRLAAGEVATAVTGLDPPANAINGAEQSAGKSEASSAPQNETKVLLDRTGRLIKEIDKLAQGGRP